MSKRYSFDPRAAACLAECEGGSVLDGGSAGPGVAYRVYRGRLTGIYFDDEFGCRWYQMVGVEGPPGHEPESDVYWCEQGSLYYEPVPVPHGQERDAGE